MPVIEVLYSDLEKLLNTDLPSDREALNEILAYVKGEVDRWEGDEMSIEIKDGNRPDLWSVEGIARELRGVLGIEEGLIPYTIHASSGIEVRVSPGLHDIRPYIAASIVKGVRLTDDIIREFMHLQDKLDHTYGRRRGRASIGLYNYDLLTPPLQYTLAKPTEISFVPLGEKAPMDLKTILRTHPKGIQYGHIINKYPRWPILMDSRDKVLSIPPIINSNDLGRITEGEHNIFVEVTGTVYRTVLNTLNLVTLSLADRGHDILSTLINYPYPVERQKHLTTPQFPTSSLTLPLETINQVLGIPLSLSDVEALLKKARYDVTDAISQEIKVIVPSYRIDVMHPLDVIEDIAIMYGYNNITPRWPNQITFGEISTNEHFVDLTREIIVGLGFQEILSFTLTNKETLVQRMGNPDTKIVELINPSSQRFTCLRNWLLPGLLKFLSHNTHIEYPQKIFEVGECVNLDDTQVNRVSTHQKLGCVIAHSTANFSEMKSEAEAFFRNIGIIPDLVIAQHPTFIKGRVGRLQSHETEIGILGEIHPRILEEWRVETPVTAFELNLTQVQTLLQD
ncbi:MAG: phenylalanine--tRNA ligase subunit beta [Candidatus Bathyarchaeota archaeon]|jgi:phenylalanyl-tRNA synthetase beta chain|nr:phenylalanine--tRNA ligase subunit beta [Candidatus Bathyarchaeota archaeon]